MSEGANAQIRQIMSALREKGRFVPASVAEIDMLPFDDFEELQHALRARAVVVQRFAFAYETGVFDLFASRTQRLLGNLYMGIAFIGPIACLVLAFIYSWWWMAGVLLIFVGLSRNKKLYNNVVLRAAMQSELAFAFLFFTRQVSVTTSDFETSYYWNVDE